VRAQIRALEGRMRLEEVNHWRDRVELEQELRKVESELSELKIRLQTF
jgi:hypothetical protein